MNKQMDAADGQTVQNITPLKTLSDDEGITDMKVAKMKHTHTTTGVGSQCKDSLVMDEGQMRPRHYLNFLCLIQRYDTDDWEGGKINGVPIY